MPDQDFTNDDWHPFLTPRGLRLQQQLQPHQNSDLPLPMPVVSPGWADGSVAPPTVEELQRQLLQNIQASKRFPDPMRLKRSSLSRLFKTSLVSASDLPRLRAVGKLRIQFSADPNKPMGVGSAWVAGPSLIVTAAHNVFDSNTQQWARRVQFAPGHDGYSQGAPQWFGIDACAIPKFYQENPTTNADVAYLYADNNVGDIIDSSIPIEPLRDLELFENEAVDIVGYPAGSHFDFGKQLWRSRGKFLFGQRSGPGDPFGPVLATDFGGGASGCPWIVIRDGNPLAVGLTSGHGKLGYGPNDTNLMSLTSPFFGDPQLESLFDNQVFHTFNV